jgi:hypothetical protein
MTFQHADTSKRTRPGPFVRRSLDRPSGSAETQVVGKMEPMRRWVPSFLLAGALALDVLLIRSHIELAIGSAACLERANFELISCVAPPPDWQLILLPAVAISLAMLLGVTLARRSGPISTQAASDSGDT